MTRDTRQSCAHKRDNESYRQMTVYSLRGFGTWNCRLDIERSLMIFAPITTGTTRRLMARPLASCDVRNFDIGIRTYEIPILQANTLFRDSTPKQHS